MSQLGLATDNILFTKVAPDLASLHLGTGFNRFESAFGIDGLMKNDGKRLDILAIHAWVEGRGACRCFIAQAKKMYHEVRFWYVDNTIFEAALKRYGFQPFKETAEDGEIISGYAWKEAE